VLCHTRYCAEHQRETTRAYDRARGSAASRGYGARHRRWRELVLARDPVCVDPFGDHAAVGEVAPSTDADHIKRIEEGGARFDLANGQGLCATCHGKKTAMETRAKPGAKA
jgi:5-methylcytosine-specific restriction protein A